MNHVPRTSKDEALVTALVTLSKAVETLSTEVTKLKRRVKTLERQGTADGRA